MYICVHLFYRNCHRIGRGAKCHRYRRYIYVGKNCRLDLDFIGIATALLLLSLALNRKLGQKYQNQELLAVALCSHREPYSPTHQTLDVRPKS